MADIFLSYRRSDAPSATGRLADTLQAVFGADRVFRDVLDIAPGDDFEATLRRAVGGARVLLAVVGPGWLHATDAAGRRRLDDPGDMVRREIEAALDAGVAVIPVLVDGARMPPAEVLPASLAAFSRCQAVPLDDTRWAADTQRLADALRREHGVEPGVTASGAPARGFALELLELLLQPRRGLLQRAGRGSSADLLRAAGLLLACLVIGNLLLGGALETALASWVLSGTLIGLLWAPALAALVVLAWRIAGAASGWQRSAAGGMCLVGGAWVYLTAGMAVFAIGVSLADRSVLPGALDAARHGLPPLAAIEAHMARGVHGPALAAIVLATLVWAAGLVWLFAAWRGLRLALLRPWWAGPLAGLVFVALLLAVLAAAGWAAASPVPGM